MASKEALFFIGAGVAYVICRERTEYSSIPGGISLIALGKWGYDTYYWMLDLPLAAVQELVKQTHKLVRSLGLGGLLSPVMKILESSIAGMRTWLRNSAAPGLLLGLLAAMLILRMVR
jgi:hypothetical protein